MPVSLLPRNLHQRIGIAIAAVIFALCLGLATILGSLAEQRVTALNAATLTGLSDQLARELSFGLDRLTREIVNQTSRDLYRDPAAKVADLRAALDLFQKNNPEFAHMSIVDAQTGRVLAATGGIFEGGDARGRPVYERGKEGVFVGDVHDAVRLAELLPRPPGGEPLRFLDIAAPIRAPDGVTRRVLATHIAFQWTAEMRDHVFSNVRERQGIDATLIDSAGKVVLSGAPDVRMGMDLGTLLGPQGGTAFRSRWPDGKEYLTAVTATEPHGRFEGFGWRVVARQPYTTTLAPVQDTRYALLTGGLALAVLASLVAWFVSRAITRPVRLLAEAASAVDGWSKLGQGSMAGSVGEVRDMELAFRQLAGRAREHQEASTDSERKFETLAASLPEIVWVAEAGGRIVYVNRDFPFAAPGETVSDIDGFGRGMTADDRAGFEAVWGEARSQGKPMTFRCRLAAPGTPASTRWFDIAMRPLHDDTGALRRWVGTVMDIDKDVTDAQRTAAALQQAEQTGRIRDAFIATASHELRSPLNAILGWSEIGERRQVEDAQVSKALAVIRRNALRQAAIINDMIDMSAALAGRLALTCSVFDLRVLADEVVRAQVEAAGAKGVSLSCAPGGEGTMVEADRARLSSVLAKLVDNGIKFTEAGGRVTVRVRGDGRKAEVLVEDTGRGIAADFLPHVFDRMRQEDASFARKAGGLGLGLAIARAVVQLHHGDVTVSSPGVGLGTTVAVSLAAVPEARNDARAEEAAADGATAPARSLEGIAILLVDDEPDAREVAQAALGTLGAKVQVAKSGAEALQALRSSNFDVLVSDVGMPGMDGLDLVRRVRALTDRPNSGIPAVALTAFAQESNRRDGLAAGFDAYVAKPISIPGLADGILSAMSRVRGPNRVRGSANAS